MIKITRGNQYYRPYTTYVNDVERFVDKIKIYDKEGIILTINQGWLENKDKRDISELKLNTNKELRLRRKEKLDGEVFIMNTQSNYRDEKRCILYLPNELVGFERIKRYLNFSYTVVDVWESKIIGAKHEVWRHDFELNDKLYSLSKEFDKVKEEYDFNIKSDIRPFINKLETLKKEYENHVKWIKSLDINKL